MQAPTPTGAGARWGAVTKPIIIRGRACETWLSNTPHRACWWDAQEGSFLQDPEHRAQSMPRMGGGQRSPEARWGEQSWR